MIRSLIVLPADPEEMSIGGIAAFVRGFVRFAPAEWHIEMVGVSRRRALWRRQPVSLEGKKVDLLPIVHYDGRRGSIPLALRFSAALTRHRSRIDTADRVTQFHRPATDLALLRRRGPRFRVVHSPREDLTDAASESRWRRIGEVLDRVERVSFRRMDRIYVVNRMAADRYRRRFPEVADRIRFLPNWFDPSTFQPVNDAERRALRTRLAAEHGLTDRTRILLFAGRLEGAKRPELAISALQLAAGRSPSPLIVFIAGAGQLRASIERTAEQSGVTQLVRFLGTLPKDELAQLMNAADGLLISSAFETGPTVGLEALACGLPVVTTPVGEVGAMVRGGEIGWAASDHSPAALAEGIEWVIGLERDTRRAACAWAAEPFRADRVLAEVYDLHRELADRLRDVPAHE